MEQAYFVVAVNDDGSVFIDYDVAAAHLPNGAIWNETNEQWENEHDHANFYEPISESLGDYLRDLNLLKGDKK
jgi:hypothetical protein